MQAEMTEHFGYAKHDPVGHNSGNSRTGGTTKALKGDFGEVPLETPRDRNGSYEPKIIAKGQREIPRLLGGIDSEIRGATGENTSGEVLTLYATGLDMQPDLARRSLIGTQPIAKDKHQGSTFLSIRYRTK